MCESYINDMETPTSDCCREDICDEKNTPYCSSCRRSCIPVVTCQRCKGRGEYLGESNEMTGCEICDGEGIIFLEDK